MLNTVSIARFSHAMEFSLRTYQQAEVGSMNQEVSGYAMELVGAGNGL